MARIVWMSVCAAVWAAGCDDEGLRESRRVADGVRSSVEVDRETALADGADGVVVKVTIRNEEGRPVPDAVVVLSFDGERLIAQPMERTDASGVTTTTVRTTLAQTVTVTAQVLAVRIEERPVVRFVPGPAARLGFAVSPKKGVAGDELSPAPEVEAFDAFDNRSSRPEVLLSLDGGDRTATLQGETQAAAGEGSAVFASLVVDRPGEGFVLVASSPELESARSEPFDLRAGVPSEPHTTFEVTQEGLQLDDGFFAQLVLEARDEQGNAFAGAAVAFESNVAGDLVTPAQATTGDDGRLETRLESKKDGLRQVTARVAGFEKTLDLVFGPLPPDRTRSTATHVDAPDAEAYDADGHTYARIEVVARDRFDNLLPGLPVAFESTHLDLFFDGSATVTDDQGVAVGRVASTREGTRVIRIVVDGVTLGPKPEITFRPIDREWAHWPMVEPAKWRFTVDGDVVRDTVTRLVWQRELATEARDQSAAEAYCDALVLDGRDDWRLPTRIELISIASDTVTPIPGDVFPDTPTGELWSATTNSGETVGFAVQMQSGAPGPHWPTDALRARCVR